MTYRRGDVWLADVPDVGHEPVLVVSWNAINRALERVIAVRITSVDRHRSLPTFVALDAGEVPGLPRRSFVICHDVVTLPKECLTERLGRISLRCLVDVEASLRSALDLGA